MVNNQFVHNLGNGGSASSSSTALPGDPETAQAVMRVMPALASALYGLQQDQGELANWQSLGEIALMLQAVIAGEPVSHPADVLAAHRGVLTSNLARERRFHRARGIVLELRGIGEHMVGWPPSELNAVHAALLNALRDREPHATPPAGREWGTTYSASGWNAWGSQCSASRRGTTSGRMVAPRSPPRIGQCSWNRQKEPNRSARQWQ